MGIAQAMVLIAAVVLQSAFAAPTPAAVPAASKSQAVKPEAASVTATDIPQKASDTQSALATLSNTMQLSKDTAELLKQLPASDKALQVNLLQFKTLSLEKLDLRELEQLAQQWEASERTFETWQSILGKETKRFEQASFQIDSMIDLWQNTQTSVKKEKAPLAIQKRVAAVLKELQHTNKIFKERYDILLVASDKVANEMLAIQKALAQIETTRAIQKKKIYVKESRHLLKALFTEPFTPAVYARQLYEENAKAFEHADEYLFSDRQNILLLTTLFIFLLVLLLFMQRLDNRDALFVKCDNATMDAVHILHRPLSSALLMTLATTVFIYDEPPQSVGLLILLAALPPMLRIMHTIAAPRVRPFLHATALLALLEIIRQPVPGTLLDDRLINLASTLALLALLYLFVRTKSLIPHVTLNRWFKFLLRLVPLLALMLIASVVANLYGSARFAKFLTSIATISLISLMGWYIVARVLIGFATLFIRRRSAQSLHIVQSYADKLQANAAFFISLFVVACWLHGVTKRLGIDQALIEGFKAFESLSIELASVTLSVKNFLDFLIIIFATYIVSKLLRTVLELEIFSRIKLPRGIPMATSMLLHYTVVFFGTILALLALGVKMSDLSLLAGAMGVGLGFGLRNILANFVSGIILIFERPIQNGDTVEIAQTLGSVKQIGVRSTTIQAYNGAEVMVPNADFMTQTVTNHTLSDTRRRFDLTVKVELNADPHRIMGLMETVAKKQGNVLEEPEPRAYFLGFGDYYLEFQLYYWLCENILQAKSEVALGIHDALDEAGIAIPQPRQEITLVKQKPPSRTDAAKPL